MPTSPPRARTPGLPQSPRAPGELSAKRELFCQRYSAHPDAARAASEAGYSARSAKQVGHELMKVPAVQQRIAELQGASAARTETEADYVRQAAREVVERCLERAPVMVRQGREWVQKLDADDRHVWQFDAQGAIGGLNLLAKLGGMFPKVSDVNVNVGGQLAVMVTHRVVDPVVRESPN